MANSREDAVLMFEFARFGAMPRLADAAGKIFPEGRIQRAGRTMARLKSPVTSERGSVPTFGSGERKHQRRERRHLWARSSSRSS
jgi:hypothetical protein